jgi:hypothetical protein
MPTSPITARIAKAPAPLTLFDFRPPVKTDSLCAGRGGVNVVARFIRAGGGTTTGGIAARHATALPHRRQKRETSGISLAQRGQRIMSMLTSLQRPLS